MDTQSRNRPVYRLAGLALLLATALGVGCAAPETSMPSISLRPYSANKSAPRSTSPRIPLMSTPADIRNDYVYPMTFMRHKLVWTGGETLWHMTFPSRRYAYGGIELRHRINLAEERETTRLVFRMRPARLAPFLSVALVDQPTNRNDRAMTDFWMQDLGPLEGDDWVNVEIDLTKFPSEALPVADGLQLEPDTDSTKRRPFDWTSVREVRFVSGGGRIPNQEIIIKNLRIQH